MSNKPIVENLEEDPGQSFLFRKIVRDNRPDHRGDGVWHYHPDFEITLTVKSSGKFFVGYNIEDYKSYELVLLGKNLPHCWITNQETEQYVINFKESVFIEALRELPELNKIKKLLDKSSQGIKFDNNTTLTAIPLIAEMSVVDGLEKLMLLFELLNLLASSEDTEFLTFNHFRFKDSIKASSRIEQIYSYIHTNYNKEEVSVTKLSDNLHMTTSSLCKFIKVITKKTFTELLVETRVKEACRFLSETDKYISEICYLSGFNNVSAFNRAFKKTMNKTPKEYRKIYR